jgi:hypothetical protein
MNFKKYKKHGWSRFRDHDIRKNSEKGKSTGPPPEPALAKAGAEDD